MTPSFWLSVSEAVPSYPRHRILRIQVPKFRKPSDWDAQSLVYQDRRRFVAQ